jgi:hypothetical protein
VFVLYDAARAVITGSIVSGIIAVLWLVFRAYHNHRISTSQVYASRHRRARLLVSAPAFVLVVALLLGCLTWFIGQTRVSKTTVGDLVDQGRTTNEAGLRTEAEVFRTTVSTTVYYRLPGNSPVANWLNQIGRYLLHENEDVDVQVAEYGYIDFATARSAAATIDQNSRTITVELPTPTVRTYIYSVSGVRFSEGPLNALGTAVKAAVAAILHQPIVSLNISGELQAAETNITRNANPAEIFGCGKNDIEQQLAGIFGSLPQYRGWLVVVQFPGTRSIPDSRCQALQNQLVHSS